MSGKVKLPSGRWADAEIMEAQERYIAAGMSGPGPDRDLVLLPEGSAKDFVRRGFVPAGFWTPTVAEAMSMDSDEIAARQAAGRSALQQGEG